VGWQPFMPRKALTSGGIVSYCLLVAVIAAPLPSGKDWGSGGKAPLYFHPSK